MSAIDPAAWCVPTGGLPQRPARFRTIQAGPKGLLAPLRQVARAVDCPAAPGRGKPNGGPGGARVFYHPRRGRVRGITVRPVAMGVRGLAALAALALGVPPALAASSGLYAGFDQGAYLA